MNKLSWIKDYYAGLSGKGKKLFLMGALCSVILLAEIVRKLFFS